MKMSDLKPGLELGPSSWLTIDQERIDAFAEATEDRQWIHVDPARAKHGAFGSTIAHGYLTLSLIAGFAYELVPIDDAPMGVNYGLDRVRFPAPVPVGSRIRATFRVDRVDDVGDGLRVPMHVTVERDGHDKPVCAADIIFRYFR
jgi:acyl dehydratase